MSSMIRAMQRFGLTGGIASGKSAVSQTLRGLGAEVLDADAVYHELIAPRDGRASDLARAIGERFDGVIRSDGSIDRAALGARVFADPAELAALGAITHPAVAVEVAQRVAALSGRGLPAAVYDVPLLYERSLAEGMHGVIVVWVPRELQIERLMARDGIDRDAAEQKIATQLPLDEKRARATWVIDNSGPPSETRRQTEQLWRQIAGKA